MTLKYEMETKKITAQNEAEIQEIENLKLKNKMESAATAEANSIKIKAEANILLFTKEYLIKSSHDAMYNSAKIIIDPNKNSHNLMNIPL